MKKVFYKFLLSVIFLLLALPSSLALITDYTNYFNMNEGSGTKLINLANGSNNITLYNGTTFDTGIILLGTNYSKNNQSGIMQNYQLPNASKSISIWVYPRNNSYSQVVVGGGTGSSPLGAFGIGYHYNSTYNTRFWLHSQGTNADIISNQSSLINNWHLVVITQNASGTRKIYVDGNFTGEVRNSTFNIGNQGIRLGLFSDGSGSSVDMKMDELKIYHRELTASDVLELYRLETISLNYPENLLSNRNYSFNLSSSGINNLSNSTLILGYLNGSNYTLNGNPQYNYTLSFPLGGTYTLYTFVTNTSNYRFNQNFSISVSSYYINSVNYTNQTYETQTNEFNLNITYDPVYFISTSAILYYNNTAYTSTKTSSSNMAYFLSSAVAPVVQGTTNIPFYWTIQFVNLSGSTVYYNGSFYNQSVLNLTVDDCSTFTNRLFNFTMYDEDALTLISANNSFEITLTINDYTNLSMNKSNSASFPICSESPMNSNYLYADYIVKYSSTNPPRVTEYYNVRNFAITLNTSNTNISLYNLNSSRSTECLINVLDENRLPFIDLQVEMQRRYIGLGSNKIVEIPSTDSSGQTIGHFVTSSEIYDLILKNNGQTLKSYLNQIVVPQYTGECVINLRIDDVNQYLQNYNDYLGVSYEEEYSTSSGLYTFTYVATDGENKDARLLATLFNPSLNTTYCDETKSGLTNTIVCNLGTVDNKSVIVEVYINEDLLYRTTVQTQDYVDEYTDDRYLLAIAIIIGLVLMGISSPQIAVFNFILGLLVTGYMGLYRGSVWSVASWFIIGALVISWKISRRRE